MTNLERQVLEAMRRAGGMPEGGIPDHLRWLLEAPLVPPPPPSLIGKGSVKTSKGTGSGSSKGTGGTPPIDKKGPPEPPEGDEESTLDGEPAPKSSSPVPSITPAKGLKPEEPEEEPEPKGIDKAANPKGPSVQPYVKISPRTISVVTFIARSARDRKLVRIYYTPKVTTGKTVSRTIEPYSVRFRNIHVDGYDRPPRRTVVVFGHDVNKGHIKMFVADRIRTATATGRTFRPRWDVEFESVLMDAAERRHVLHEHGVPERKRLLGCAKEAGTMNRESPFIEEKDNEGGTHVQRDRSPKDKRPDASKSAKPRANYRKNRGAYERGQADFVRSPKGKDFYKKLARFNAERGAEAEDLGFTRDEILGGAFDSDSETTGLLKKVFK